MAKKKETNSTGGLFLTQEQVDEITALFDGLLLRDGNDLVDRLKRNQTIYLTDGIEVILTEDDLWALQQQSVGMSRDFQEYVQEFVEDSINLQLNGDVRARRY